jgi:hypothetical protein
MTDADSASSITLRLPGIGTDDGAVLVVDGEVVVGMKKLTADQYLEALTGVIAVTKDDAVSCTLGVALGLPDVEVDAAKRVKELVYAELTADGDKSNDCLERSIALMAESGTATAQRSQALEGVTGGAELSRSGVTGAAMASAPIALLCMIAKAAAESATVIAEGIKQLVYSLTMPGPAPSAAPTPPFLLPFCPRRRRATRPGCHSK